MTRLGDQSDEKSSTLRGRLPAGGYTASVIIYNRPETSTYHISPGDLDEGITALLVFRGDGDAERQGARLRAGACLPHRRHQRRRILPAVPGVGLQAGRGTAANVHFVRSTTGRRVGRRRGPTPRHSRRVVRATSRRHRARHGSACAGRSRPCPSPRSPGRSRTRRPRPSATTSHHREAFDGTPLRWNATVVRVRGHVSIGMVRRMSHISRCGIEVVVAEFTDPTPHPGAERRRPRRRAPCRRVSACRWCGRRSRRVPPPLPWSTSSSASTTTRATSSARHGAAR